MTLRIAVLLGLTSLALYGSAYADYTARDDVQEYIDELVAEHGFTRQDLVVLFGRAKRQQTILEAIARPAERTLKWHEYRKIFLKEPRISQGLEFWNDNETALSEAQQRYGVAPEIVVAILGVETRYGRNSGSYRVLDALSTLAFDYPAAKFLFQKGANRISAP